ncbi:hypothetical protein [Bacillus velezensis]|uniref:hypothetical protein n=1 Tax=Bacillus velezensis TaxID=492670 RepID=UPI003C6C2858
MYYSLYVMGIHAMSAMYSVYLPLPLSGKSSALCLGGFGSFDLLFSARHAEYGFPQEAVVTSIVIYRIVYSFIPFVFGLFFAAGDLTENTLKRLESNPKMAPAVETTNVLLVFQRAILIRVLYGSLSLLVFMAGVVVLASVALPIDRETVIPHIPRRRSLRLTRYR